MNKKVIIWSSVGVVVVGLLMWLLWPSKKDVSFKTQIIKPGVIEKNVTATGYLQPADKVEVGTQVSGIVEKLYVTYNSKVKKGQKLAELDKSTLYERLSQVKATKASAESALTLAKQNYDRTKTLYEAGAETQAAFEDATNKYIQAQNALANEETKVREAQVNLGYSVITSPIDGIVLAKQVEQGQTVASSFSTPTLFIIAKDLKSMNVEADIDEADIGSVKVGQKVTFTVDSYMGEIFNGEVKEIRLEPKVTSNVVTYTVIVKADNPEEKLFPGMTASVTIITSQQTGNLVPMAALNFEPTEELFKAIGKPSKQKHKKEGKHHSMEEDSLFASMSETERENVMKNMRTVWVKNGKNIFPAPVITGMNDGVNAIITGGRLAEGDTVVLSAQIGAKDKPHNGGAKGNNPFMPQRPGKKK